MPITQLVGLIASLLAIAAVLIGVLWKLARIDFRVEQMWAVFTQQFAGTPAKGRRRLDRTLQDIAIAHDRDTRSKSD